MPSKPRYPFAELAVGEAFDVPREKENSIRVTARYHGEKLGRRFCVRVIRGENVIEVSRLPDVDDAPEEFFEVKPARTSVVEEIAPSRMQELVRLSSLRLKELQEQDD